MVAPSDNIGVGNAQQFEDKRGTDAVPANSEGRAGASSTSLSMGVLPAKFGRSKGVDMSTPPMSDQVLSGLSLLM